MRIDFYKYQGTGNDFVIFDNRNLVFDKTNLKAVSKLCDRKFGIGADGLILIENHPNLDFELIYFNADGSKSFCGNGSRCGVAFAKFLGIIDSQTTFNAIDGVHEAKILEDVVELKMGDVEVVEKGEGYYYIHTGSPHYIVHKKDIYQFNMVEEAKRIRYNERFKKEGTNVNFVQKKDNLLQMRTYERGVENETLSCGTGATAVALSGALEFKLKSPVDIKVQGGELKIKFIQINSQQFHDIWLIGKTEQVFQGSIQI